MNKKPTRRYFHSDNKLYVKLLGGALREGTTDYYNDDNLVANKRVFQNEKRGATLYSFGTPNPKTTSLDPKTMHVLYDDGNKFYYLLTEIANEVQNLGRRGNVNDENWKELFLSFSSFKSGVMAYLKTNKNQIIPDVNVFLDKIINAFVYLNDILSSKNLNAFNRNKIYEIRDFLQTVQNLCNKAEMYQNSNNVNGGGGGGGGGGGDDDDDDDDDGDDGFYSVGAEDGDDEFNSFDNDDDDDGLSSHHSYDITPAGGGRRPIMGTPDSLQSRLNTSHLVDSERAKEGKRLVEDEKSFRTRMKNWYEENIQAEKNDELRQDNHASAFGENYTEPEEYEPNLDISDPFINHDHDIDDELVPTSLLEARETHRKETDDMTTGQDGAFREPSQEDYESAFPQTRERQAYEREVAEETGEDQGEPGHKEGDNAQEDRAKTPKKAGRPAKDAGKYPNGANRIIRDAIDTQYEHAQKGNTKVLHSYKNIDMVELYPKLTKDEQAKVDFIQDHLLNQSVGTHAAVEPPIVPANIASAINRQYNKMKNKNSYGLNETYKIADIDAYYPILNSDMKQKVDDINKMRKEASTATQTKSSRR